MRSHRWQAWFVAVTVSLAGLAGAVPWGQSVGLAAQPSTDCVQSDVWNTAILEGGLDPTVVVAGEEINGSVGFLRLRNLPAATSYHLEAPDGTQVGPRALVSGEVVFQDVPFCKTGIWSVVGADGVTYAHFETYRDSATPGVPSIQVDAAAPTSTALDYQAGSGTVDEGADCSFQGELTPSIGSGEKQVEVAMDWTAKNLDESSEAGLFSVAATGEAGSRASPHVTTVEVLASGDGAVTVPALWRAGGVYEVNIVTDYLHDGARVHTDACGEDIVPTP